MAVQLPAEAQGAAGGVLTYSIFCLLCAVCLFWMAMVHSERTSYVAMLSWFLSLNCLASIIQQIHTIIDWTDVKTAQHAYLVANAGNPVILAAGSSVGLDLVLFYIQFYTYNVDAMIVLFWAWELTCSVYHLRMLKQMGPLASLGAKAAAALLPVIQLGLMQTKAVQSSTPVFLFVANVIIGSSVCGGCGFLLAILYKYIMTRRAFMSWNVQYGKSGSGAASRYGTGSGTRSHNAAGRAPSKQSIYDRWLVVRFSVAFFALCVFQGFTIYFQIRSAATNSKANVPKQADLSAGQAIADFVLFLPGVSEGFMAFVVFGTTRTFRNYVVRTIIPQRLLARRQAKAAIKPTTSGTFDQAPRRRSESSTSRLKIFAKPLSGQQSPTPDVYHRIAEVETHVGSGSSTPRKEAWASEYELPELTKPRPAGSRTYGW